MDGIVTQSSHQYTHVCVSSLSLFSSPLALEHVQKIGCPPQGQVQALPFDLFTLPCVVDGNPDQWSAPSSDASMAVCRVKSQTAVSGITLPSTFPHRGWCMSTVSFKFLKRTRLFLDICSHWALYGILLDGLGRTRLLLGCFLCHGSITVGAGVRSSLLRKQV